MSAYFGGYLFKLLHRGAAPIALPRRQVTPVLPLTESALTGTAAEASEVETGSHELSTETSLSGRIPMTAPSSESLIINAPPKSTATSEGGGAATADQAADGGAAGLVIKHENAVTRDMLTIARDMSTVARDVPTLTGDGSTLATNVPAIADTPSSNPAVVSHKQPKDIEPTVSYAASPTEDHSPVGPASQNRRAHLDHRVNEVFEFKMPDNFFGQRSQASAGALTAPRQSEAPADLIVHLESPRLLGTGAIDSTRLVPKHPGALSQALDAGEPGSSNDLIQRSQPQERNLRATQQLTAASMQGSNDEAKRTEALVAQVTSLHLGAVPPQPRQEQTPHLSLRSPPEKQADVSPPARLRINPLDIQIVTQPPAAQPSQTSALDMAQLFERRHLGRTDLIV